MVSRPTVICRDGEATAASRGYVRSAMDGVGPLTVVGTAAVGGLLTVLMMRRRRRR